MGADPGDGLPVHCRGGRGRIQSGTSVPSAQHRTPIEKRPGEALHLEWVLGLHTWGPSDTWVAPSGLPVTAEAEPEQASPDPSLTGGRDSHLT